MSGLKKSKCIVCGETIWWDNDPLPIACFHHTYGEVWDAKETNEQDLAFEAERGRRRDEGT